MRNFLLLISIFFITEINAQDIHLSQFHAAPLLLNPALTGAFGGEVRLVANYRSQWDDIPVPYKTQAFSVDSKFQTKNRASFFGLGLTVSNDVAGDLDFQTTLTALSLSYQRFMGRVPGRKADIYLRMGFQAGQMQQRFDYTNIHLEDPSAEMYVEPSLKVNDYSTGIVLAYIEKYLILYGGVKLDHISNPSVSFYEGRSVVGTNEISRDKSEFLFQKMTLHASADISFRKKNFSILPDFQYSRQLVHQELLLGGYLRFNHLFTKQNQDKKSIYWNIGAWSRWGDALIVSTKWDFANSLSIGISYDTTISKATIPTSGFGAIELSMVYTLQTPRTIKEPSQSGGMRQKMKCPYGGARPYYKNPWYRDRGLGR